MSKKILILAITIVILISAFFITYILVDRKNNEIALNEMTENSINISKTLDSAEEVTDDCLNEWNDYNQYVNERIEEASNNLAEDDTHYLLKDVLGYIEVYYLDENNEQYLYKKTTIPTAYLSQEDIEDLKIGIEVTGIEALNKTLEDFE